MLYTCVAFLTPNLDSGCHVCFCKVDCLQTRGKLYTAVSAPVCEAEHLVQRVAVGIQCIQYTLQLVATYIQYTIHAKNYSQDQVVFSYVIGPMTVVPTSLT